ncbi:MAG: hypothetical protein GY863_06165, partial [bacterium]|nr:hypothetical protein [bacterium]
NSEFNDVSTRLGMRKVYPHSETGIGGFGSYPWLVSIQRSFSDKMSAGITVSWTRIGETTGLRDDYYFLEVEYSVLTVASVIELHLFNFLNIGAGPAMYIAESCQIEPQDQITARNQSTMFGYLIDLGLMIPSKRRSYFEIKWQYRGVGDVDVGPYDVTLPDGTMTFSGSRVKFNHSYLGLGLGVRF